jgi:hypothetical protein
MQRKGEKRLIGQVAFFMLCLLPFFCGGSMGIEGMGGMLEHT